MHPMELASKVHYELVRIHPFTDGNGRVARLVMNLILMRNKFPPTVIKFSAREKYYSTLEVADEGDLKPFFSFISSQTAETLDLILSILSGKEQKKSQRRHKIYQIRLERKISQIELSKLTGVGQAMISRIESLKEKPTKATLQKFAKVFKVKVEDLA